MSNVNLAMAPARRLELHDHPAPPAGAEVHADGIWHEVQRGDGVNAIARDYSRAYHMDITPMKLYAANDAALRDGLQAGELLRIPNLADRFDSMILARNPHLVRVGDRMLHGVQSGDTLSKIARQYNDANGTRVTWQQIYAANKATIGADPSRIRPGQQLSIPGITTNSAKATLQSLAELDTDQVLTRTARVKHEDGSVDTIDVVSFKADSAHAKSYATADAALAAAQTKVRSGSGTTPVAVIQTRDGAYAVMPLRGNEVSDNLDDSDRTLSLAYRSDDRGVLAVVDKRWDTGAVETRRYDR